MTGTKIDISALRDMPDAALRSAADQERKRRCPSRVQACAIMNAKSGACPEDCAFCAQSCRHGAAAPVYPLKETDEITAQALEARDSGAERFGIVTSGPALTRDEVSRIADAVSAIVRAGGIRVCASLGSITPEDFRRLKSAGLTRYHHNIESSASFYPRIVSTHTFESRIRTIRAAREAGLEVCSGGIIGMGESMDDRISMAGTLRDLEVDSIPVNVLMPVKGTPLEGAACPGAAEIMRTIALFRMIVPDALILLAAGRESYDAREAFMSGANGIMIGDYLTKKGSDAQSDRVMIGEVTRQWIQGR